MRRQSERKIKLKFCLIFLTMFICFSGYAQSQRITGKITGADDGRPVPGATVKVKGTSVSSVSDVNGDYAINAKPTDVLVFSFVSYATQEIPVKSNNSINVKLVGSNTNLNEVVVIGYAKQPRKDNTGSISSIKGDDLRQTQPTTFDQALQGKVAGVVVQQISGQPGGGVSIQIRGISSISGSKYPLFVI